jgi:hypothetical protein
MTRLEVARSALSPAVSGTKRDDEGLRQVPQDGTDRSTLCRPEGNWQGDMLLCLLLNHEGLTLKQSPLDVELQLVIARR